MSVPELTVGTDASPDHLAAANGPIDRALGVAANALSVMAGKTLTMGFGCMFWLLAAHDFARPEVGLAAGVVSAMMLCTQLAIGGVGSAVITCYSEHRRQPAGLLDTSATVVVLSALFASGVFLAAASLGLRHLSTVASHPLYAAAFTLMTVCGTLAILLDQLSIALGRGDQVLVRGLAFGAVTVLGLVLLPLMRHNADSFAIFAPWAIAGVVNVVLGVIQLRRLLPAYRYRWRIEKGTVKLLTRHGFPNYALTLAERAPGLILPIIVIEVLTPAGNATWYVIWMMAWVVYTMPISAGLTLFAEGSNRPAELRSATRQAVRVALLAGLAASLVLAGLAHVGLSLLGASYGRTGATALRILLLAFVPLTFVQAYFATSRARRRLGEAVIVGWLTAAASIGVATVGGIFWGLTGMASGWLAVQTAAGAWALSRSTTDWLPSLIGLSGKASASLQLRFEASRVRAHRLGETVREVGYAPPLIIAGGGLALGLWIIALRGVTLGRMSGLGLISVLDNRFDAAIVVAVLTFTATLLRRRVSEPLLLGLTLLLIVMLFGLTPLLESVPRFAVTWRHVGIAQTIIDSGRIDPRVDAYFNWPGFFVLVGVMSRLAGFASPITFAAWSPLYLNLAYLLPLLLIFRSLTGNRRLVWLSVWVFFLGNWIGQDYFSPQGFSFFFYLLIVAVLLRWCVDWPPERPVDIWLRASPVTTIADTDDESSTSPAPRRGAIYACVVALYAVLVPTHQLTPVAALFSTAAIVLVAARRLLWLPALMSIMLVAWWATGARTFLNGHLGRMLGQAGRVDAAFSQNVANRIGGDIDHRIVADLTLLAGAMMWGLACLGAWRLLRQSRRYRVPAALCLAAIPLLALQTYGGEMLLRVQLFALPFTAFFAAAALVDGFNDQRRVLRSTVIVGGLLTLAALFMFARYGNEKIDNFTRDEQKAVVKLYALAKPGSILVAGTGNLPWKYEQYVAHHYRLVIQMPHWSATAAAPQNLTPLLADIRNTMSASTPRAYLIIGRSEEAEVDQLGYGTPGSLARVATAIRRSPMFTTVYTNPDASIFTIAPTPIAKPRPAPSPGVVKPRSFPGSHRSHSHVAARPAKHVTARAAKTKAKQPASGGRRQPRPTSRP
jgi:O-antigen/teichoic acid export membrane protein